MIAKWMTTNLQQRFANKNLDFDVYFKPYAIEKLSLWDASCYTIKKIANFYDNLFLSLSGGLDSEFVLKVCIENKIPIKPIIVVMNGHEEETSYALKFCKRNNITPIVVKPTDREIIKLWYDYIYTIYGRGRHSCPILKSLEIAEQQDGWLLTGDCPPTSDEHSEDIDLPMHNSFHLAEWDFYVSELFGHPGGLLGYSQECMYGFLNEIDTNLSTQKAKSKLYDLEMRPKIYSNHSKATKIVFTELTSNESKFSVELGTYEYVKNILANIENNA